MQRSVVRGQRLPRCGGVRRLRVVDEADAADLGDELEPVWRRPRTSGAPRRSPRRRTGRAGRRGRGGRVLAVVRPGDRGSAGSGSRRRTRCASPRRERPKPRGTTAARPPSGLEDPELRRPVRLERAVPVEVVRLEVQQHRDPGSQLVDVLELERRELETSHAPAAGSSGSRACRRSRRPRRERRPTEHRAEQLGRRRLAVRARDADDGVRRAGGRRARPRSRPAGPAHGPPSRAEPRPGRRGS